MAYPPAAGQQNPGHYAPPGGQQNPGQYPPPGGQQNPGHYAPPGGQQIPGHYAPPGGQQNPGQYPPPAGQAWRPGQGDKFQWDNLPSAPLPDNPDALPPPYQPPQTQPIPGYEGAGHFGQFAPLPPPPAPPPPSGPPPPVQFEKTAQLTEDECRQAMLDFVSKNCCYGDAPAKEMKITEITSSTALHYTLETFCETRSTAYQHEPYRGEPIDGPENGPPPGPWAINCQPNRQFEDHEKYIEVPHTSYVTPCSHCDARGFLRCYRCYGHGWLRCTSCGGDGTKRRRNAEGNFENHTCYSCGGDGRRRCMTCSGDGRVVCTTCRGFRNLRCFIMLTVKFINHKDDHIIERTDMPDELVRDVAGAVIFEQIMPQVWPIVAFYVQDINVNSQKLVDEHQRSFNDERKLMQRHRLREIPVTEVHYTWDDVKTRFWVYGREKEVHAPDYPEKCCWGCNIL